METERLVTGYELEMNEAKCQPGQNIWSAVARLKEDIGEALPYLNAELKTKFYDHDRRALVCVWNGHRFSVTPQEILSSQVENRADASNRLDAFVAKINEIWDRRDSIEPCTEGISLPNLMDIFKRLPRTNCGDCGCPTCMAFAGQVRQGEAAPSECPHLSPENRGEIERMVG